MEVQGQNQRDKFSVRSEEQRGVREKHTAAGQVEIKRQAQREIEQSQQEMSRLSGGFQVEGKHKDLREDRQESVRRSTRFMDVGAVKRHQQRK